MENEIGGRPTLYTAELLEKARSYLDEYETKHGSAIPSQIGLAKALGVSRKTLHNWANDPDKSELAFVLEQVMQEQHEVAWTKGLRGEYSATLVKLLLGKHGYSDRQELSGPDGGPVLPLIREIKIVGLTEDSGRR